MRLPLLSMLFSVLGLGVLLPWIRGLSYLDPHLLFAVAQIPLAFTSRLTLAFAESRPLLWAGVLAAVCAHGIGVLVVGNGLLTVNLLNWLGYPYLPPAYFLISLWGLSMASTLFTGLGTAWLLSRGTAPGRAVLAGRAMFFAALFTVILLDRGLNPDGTGSVPLAKLGVVVACLFLACCLVLVWTIEGRKQ